MEWDNSGTRVKLINKEVNDMTAVQQWICYILFVYYCFVSWQQILQWSAFLFSTLPFSVIYLRVFGSNKSSSMHDAYEPVPILEKLPLQIDCLAAWGEFCFPFHHFHFLKHLYHSIIDNAFSFVDNDCVSKPCEWPTYCSIYCSSCCIVVKLFSLAVSQNLFSCLVTQTTCMDIQLVFLPRQIFEHEKQWNSYVSEPEELVS